MKWYGEFLKLFQWYVCKKYWETLCYIEGTTKYQPALALLQRAYVKSLNTIMARHMLFTRSQPPWKSLEEFLKQLRQLAKGCNFAAVAQTYREEMISDAFIKGLNSANVRQRVLESEDTTLQRAFCHGIFTYSSWRTCQSILSRGHLAATRRQTNDGEEKDNPADHQQNTSAATNKTISTKLHCYFCGGIYHRWERCPAKNAECFNCQKKDILHVFVVQEKLKETLHV